MGFLPATDDPRTTMKRREIQRRSGKQKKLSHVSHPVRCGASFAVTEDYDRKGMHIAASNLPKPAGSVHDPRNSVLTLDYQEDASGKSRLGTVILRLGDRAIEIQRRAVVYWRWPDARSPVDPICGDPN